MSRPAETTEMSSGLLCMTRLPREVPPMAMSMRGGWPRVCAAVEKKVVQPMPSTGSVPYWPSAVPESTMSRPARMATGPLPSYQLPAEVDCAGLLPCETMEPVRTPIASPATA